MGHIQGVILDVDGTLVDSNDAHTLSWVEALEEAGLKVAYERVRPLIGMGGDKLLPLVCGIEVDSPQGKQISKRRQEIFQTRYLPRLHATPGAHDLLLHMHAGGLQLVVASSAKEEELTGLLKICGADQVIDGKTSADDAEKSKPDPDIVQVALGELGFSPAKTIMLGDTPYDVKAAARAGVPVIALRCGGWQDADLAGAIAIYDAPADLLAHYGDSPLAQ